MYLKVANSMAVSGLSHFCPPMHKRDEETVLSPCWAPIPGSEAFFPVWNSGCWPGAVTISSSLMGGCGLSHECAEDGCNVNCVTFGG